MDTRKQISSRLRYALKHLYDPHKLQGTPLIPMLGLADLDSPTSALRQLLIREIRSMEPSGDVPDQSPLWYHYEVLLQRYVQQYTQLEVSDRLGLSIRQLRRKEHEAIRTLAERLTAQISCMGESDPPKSVRDAEEASERTIPVDGDLAWLQEPAAVASVDLAETLASLAQLVRPMANGYGVSVSFAPLVDLPPIAVHPTALRQMLLGLISTAIRCGPGKGIELTARPADRRVEISVTAEMCGASESASTGCNESLAMVKRLASACGGSLTVRSGSSRLQSLLLLPAIKQIPVLVIDDNRDMLGLVQRYISGTRYQVLGAIDLDQGLALAGKVPPRVIVLDVMMPGIDGWEILGRLRHHPLTQSVPVIVCTILPEEELARFAGAKGFVHKPFTRADLLSALDQACQGEPAPR